MRLFVLACLLLLLNGTGLGPVHAETPISLRACAGVGPGGGGPLASDGVALLGAADLMWRLRPEGSLVLSLEMSRVAGNKAALYAEVPGSRSLEFVGHQSVLVGWERSRGSPGFGPYVHGALGVGRTIGRYAAGETSNGLAVAAGAGYWLVSPGRELGLAIGLRTSHLIARDANFLSLALALGFTFYPR